MEVIKVDRQGRIVLPKNVRKALEISGGTEIICRVIGNRVMLEKFSIDLIQKAFAELEEIAPSLEEDTVEVKGEDKHVDRKYALRKIGVQGIS